MEGKFLVTPVKKFLDCVTLIRWEEQTEKWTSVLD